MTAKQVSPKLGRGLAALFGDMTTHDELPIATDEVRRLQIDLLDPSPFQPRAKFDGDNLRDLAESIRTQGLLQPILVRPHPDTPTRYQIIAGERRWRAAAIVGLHEIPVICRKMTDVESAAAALVENLQRENLNPVEEAEGYQRLIHDFGLTHEALGATVGKSRAHVGNIVRLLALPDAILDEVRKGVLSVGHARAMLTVGDPSRILSEVVTQGLSVRQTERLIRRLLTEAAPTGAMRDAALAERDLAAQIGYRVRISVSPPGDGSLTIWFNDLFQLDKLIKRLTGTAVSQAEDKD
jgi:ParB family transcriptional regulator, chromosome partitioning protein